MASTTSEDVESFFLAVKDFKDFDHAAYVNKLKEAAKRTSALSHFTGIMDIPSVGQSTTVFDAIDCADDLRKLAASTIALQMSLLTEDQEFQDVVNKDAALSLKKKSLARMIPALYGDHISRQLHDKGLKGLREWRRDENFVQAFQDKLLSPGVEHYALMLDEAKNNKYYTTTLLFINEYLKFGPGYNMSQSIRPDDDDSHWSVVMSDWIEMATTPEVQEKRPGATPDALIPSVSSVYAPHGFPDNDALTLAKLLKEQNSGDTLDWEVMDSINAFTTYGQNLSMSWDLSDASFKEAVRKSETEAIPGGMIGNSLTYTGTRVAAFLHDHMDLGLFKNEVGPRIQANHTMSFVGGFFKPGTKVMARDGDIHIEKVREGTEVITLGGPNPTYGISSDKNVTQSTRLNGNKRIALWGFNSERPFFTASHVFRTTTGLRAIDPVGAKAENPWLQVGALRVGHALLYTEDGEKYEPIEIKKLATEEANCSEVHSIHLREGLRSYHANGYLVHLNYPEITVKSVSKLLLTFSSDEQLKILSHAKELTPMFSRFGATTVMDAFHRQLTNPNGIPKADFTGRQSTVMQSGLEHLIRFWSLTLDAPASSVPMPPVYFPTLEVFEGVLLVDGKYCSNAEVRGKGLLWSRPVQRDIWEHGYCNFVGDDLTVGLGGVVRRPKSAGRQLSPHEEVHHFIAEPMKSVVHPNLKAHDSLEKITPKSFDSDSDSNFVFTPVMRSDLTVDPNKMTVTKPPIYKEIDRYSVEYDLDEYVAGKKSLTRPSELFEVFTTITVESRSKIIRIPALDKLRDQLFLEAQTNKRVTLDTVPELYESCVTSDLGTNNVTFTVTMLQPDIICRAADSYDEKDPTNLQYKNLTFAKRNINSKLPFVFSRIRFTMSWDAMELTGVAREFDPTMVGCVGKRINMAGNYKDPTLTLKRASIVAAAFRAKAGSHLDEMSAPHLAPSPIAVRLAATANKVPIDLIAGTRALHDLALDSKQVNSASQDMLLSMVKFHMTDDDRQHFIGEKKPTEGDEVGQIPVDLGTNLEENAKEWVKGTYIPAFIGRMIIETDAVTKKTWRRSLTAQEEKKIAYFWTGKGKTCLSQSKIYTRLNEIAQRNAVLRQPTTGARLKEYLADPVKDTDGATGGKKWAKALWVSQGHGPALTQIATSLGDVNSGGYNLMQKLCNIFQVLDPIPPSAKATDWTPDNEPYAMRLTDAVRGLQSDPSAMQFIGLNNDPYIQNVYQWLKDAMLALLTDLFSPTGELRSEMMQKLRDDANQLALDIGIKEEKTAAIRAVNLNQAIFGTITRLGKIWENFKINPDSKKGVGEAAKAAEKAVSSEEAELELKNVRNKGIGKALLVVVMTAMFVMGAQTAFTDWNYLSPEDHAKLVFQTLQTTGMVISLAGEAGAALLEYRAKRMGEQKLTPEEAARIELSDAESSVVAGSIEQGLRNKPQILEIEKVNALREQDLPDQGMSRINQSEGNRIQIEMTRVSEQKAPADERNLNIEEEEEISRNRSVTEGGEKPPVTPAEQAAAETAETSRFSRVWSIGKSALKGLMIAVGIALIILNTIELAKNWGNLHSDWEKALNVISIILQVMVLFLDIAGFCPGIGAILVIAGIAIMFILMYLGSKPEPPLTPVESWIDNSHGFISTLMDDPGPKLTWTDNVPNSKTPVNTDFTLSVKGTNNTGAEVVLSSLKVNFTSGNAGNALFAEMGDWTIRDKTSTTALANAQIQVTTAPDATLATKFNVGIGQVDNGTTKNDAKVTLWSYDVNIQKQEPEPEPVPEGTTPPTPDLKALNIVLAAGESVQIDMKGKTGQGAVFKMVAEEGWVDERFLPFDGNKAEFVFNQS